MTVQNRTDRHRGIHENARKRLQADLERRRSNAAVAIPSGGRKQPRAMVRQQLRESIR